MSDTAISKTHMSWFRLKCPYQEGSAEYKRAYGKLRNATYRDLERLRAEFDEHDDGSIPVVHFSIHRCMVQLGPEPFQPNMCGIDQHGSKYRVRKTINGKSHTWSYSNRSDAIAKRDSLVRLAA